MWRSGVDFKSQDLLKRDENKTDDDRTERVKVSTYADDVLLWWREIWDTTQEMPWPSALPFITVLWQKNKVSSVLQLLYTQKKKNRQWFSNHRLRIFSRHPSHSQSLSCRLLFSQKHAEDEWPHPWQCLTRIRAYPHLSPGNHLQSNSWHHILKQRLIKNPYSVWFFWTTEVNGSPWRKPLRTEKLIFLLLDFSTDPSFGHAAQV